MARQILSYTLVGRFVDEKDLPAILDYVFPLSTSRYRPPTPEDDLICRDLVERDYLFFDETTGEYGRT